MSTTILLVDPNPDDADRISGEFEETGPSNTVHVVHAGDEALDFLHQRDQYEDAPAPDIVLLNPHLPQMDGYELLNELKNEPVFKLIPVLILSDSEVADEIINSYSLHANAYLRKPDDPDELEELVEAIETFWLTIARLPPIE